MNEKDSFTGNDRLIAHVDSDLEDLIPGYLENRDKDVQAILSALDTSDYESIRKLSHSMKGSGGGYGFDGISDIALSIEEAAKRPDPEAIREWVKKLSDYLARVEVVIDSE